MRWKNRRRSSNIDDRRGQRLAGGGSGGSTILLRLLPMLLGRRGGKWMIAVVLGLMAASYFGIDLPFLSLGNNASAPSQVHQPTAAEQELAEFTAVVLADTEDTWTELFKQSGLQYQKPKLVLFSGAVQSACGRASAAVGPFYCPADKQVYIDLSFYQDLKNRHNAPGDFAQAYVIAHEVGHHVQNLLGVSDKVRQRQATLDKAGANHMSVLQELQADCFAGIWGHHADRFRQMLEPDDLDEALVAAAAIGDDRLQREAQGSVQPESFTHGTSAQRMHWFKMGFDSGSISSCDTFSTDI